MKPAPQLYSHLGNMRVRERKSVLGWPWLPGSTLSCAARCRWSQSQVLQRKVPGIWENMFFPSPPTQLF